VKKILPIILVILVVAIIFGVGGFYGGMKYAQSKTSSGNPSGQNFQNLTPEQRQQLSQNRAGRGGNGANFLSGEVISKDQQSLTIKMPDGSSKIVFYSDSTEVGKFVNGTPNDLEVGKTVTVNGAANQDGSIAAQSIQIRPATPSQP
jgi:hypothetical protein